MDRDGTPTGSPTSGDRDVAEWTLSRQQQLVMRFPGPLLLCLMWFSIGIWTGLSWIDAVLASVIVFMIFLGIEAVAWRFLRRPSVIVDGTEVDIRRGHLMHLRIPRSAVADVEVVDSGFGQSVRLRLREPVRGRLRINLPVPFDQRGMLLHDRDFWARTTELRRQLGLLAP